MGILIKWKAINPEATYTSARVYRSTSQAGSYSLIATQAIEDQSYYDCEGTTNSWYKVDFWSTCGASSLSDPIQGGTYRAYCTVEDVRNITNIKTNDLTDTEIANLIEYCGAQLNADINVFHEEEKLTYISNTKENTVNGTNTTFYTRTYPIGDSNNDMAVTTADTVVYQYDQDGNKTELSVDSVNAATGQIDLTTAPANTIQAVTVTYKNSPIRVDLPDQLIKMACALLTAAWAYTKLNVGKAPRWRMGSTQIWRDMDSFKTYYDKYLKILTQINDRSLFRTVQGTSIIDTQYRASLDGNSGTEGQNL